jgi:hypothetical protein
MKIYLNGTTSPSIRAAKPRILIIPPPAAGNTTPHPARNIDRVCGDAIAAPPASFFRIDLGALFALLSPPRRNRSWHATAIGRR